MLLALLLFTSVLSLTGCVESVEEEEFRSFDGVGNNENMTSWGTAAEPYSRHQMNASYYGGTVDGVDPTLPSARYISNLMAQSQNPYRVNNNSISQMMVYWGQFISSDVTGMVLGSIEALPILVDSTDGFIDYQGWATPVPGQYAIPFWRAPAFPGTGAGTANPKAAITTVTHWLDGSMLYGANAAEAATLWDNTTGKLYLNKPQSSPDNGNIVAAVSAINGHPPIRALANLFVLEHNQMVDRSNETTPLLKYQYARKIIIGMIQSITTREYLAALTGFPLSPYQGYDPTVNPALDHFFSVVAMRYGHSSIASMLTYETDDYVLGLLVRDSSELPKTWTFPSPTNGSTGSFQAEGYLRGLANTQEMNVDPGVIDDLRNYLTSATSPRGGSDLLAINIQRGRDLGIPRYNAARAAFGLSEYESFEEITDNVAHQNMLKAAYNNNISQIDAFVGAVCEPHPLSGVGTLFSASITEQLGRLRNGDRFWYENTEFWTTDEIEFVHGRKLGTMMNDHYGTSFPDNVFFVEDRQLASIGVNDVFPEPYPNPDGLPWKSMFLAPAYRLQWSINLDTSTIIIHIQVRTNGWAGIGLSPVQKNTMKGADIYFCTSMGCADTIALEVGPPTSDLLLPGGENNIRNVKTQRIDGVLFAMFTRDLDTHDQQDHIITDNQVVIFAFNPTTEALVYHGPTRSSAAVISWISDYVPPATLNLGLAVGLPVGLAFLILILALFAVMMWSNMDLDLKSLPVAVRWQYEQYQQNKSDWTMHSSGNFHYKVLEKKGTEYNQMCKYLEWFEFDESLKIEEATAVYNEMLISSFINTYSIIKNRMATNPTQFANKQWLLTDKNLEERQFVYNYFVSRTNNVEWNEGESVPVLPAVHGTGYSVAQAICSTGFASLSSLDSGWYGKGIYFTTYVAYALPYFSSKQDPALIISFLVPGNTYPVIEHPDAPENLQGKATVNGYNSHYVLVQGGGVVPKNYENYDLYDEIVIPQESQISPVYLVRLSHKHAKIAMKKFKEKEMATLSPRDHGNGNGNGNQGNGTMDRAAPRKLSIGTKGTKAKTLGRNRL